MKNLIIYSFLLLSFAIFAQEKDMNLPKANQEFADKNMLKLKLNTEFQNLIIRRKPFHPII